MHIEPQIDTAVREDMSKNTLKLGNSAMLEKKAKVIFEFHRSIAIVIKFYLADLSP